MSDVTSKSKNENITLRATGGQKALLRSAAEATNSSLTEFVLGSAVDQAERVLADRRWFVVSDEQFDQFVRLLDAPVPTTTKFDKLFARKSRFSQDV